MLFVNDFSSPEKEFIRIHFQLNQTQIDFLNQIDSDSQSKALRILIDKYMKQTRLLSFEKYLITFAFGFLLIGVGTILPNLYISVSSMLTGIFMVGFSLYMYGKMRIKYEKGF